MEKLIVLLVAIAVCLTFNLIFKIKVEKPKLYIFLIGFMTWCMLIFVVNIFTRDVNVIERIVMFVMFLIVSGSSIMIMLRDIMDNKIVLRKNN